MRIVVIGGVAAGMSAASQAKRRAPEAEVLVVERGAHVSYGACGLPYNIAEPRRDIEDLVVITAERFRSERGIDVRLRTEALAIDAERRSVVVRDEARREYDIEYDELVIATGASAVKLPLPGIDLPGVFLLRELSDGAEIKAFLGERTPSRAVILGAGYIGMEMAESLRKRGLEVTVLEKADRVVPGLDEELAALVRKELERHGVNVETNLEVKRIERRGEDLVVSSDRGDFAAGMVLVCVGVKPNVELAKAAGVRLGSTGAIAVDERQRTNVPHIYAAGDNAEALHVVTGCPTWVPLGTTANKQGKVAGANVVGGEESFHGIVGTAVFKVFDLEVGRTGLSSAEVSRQGLPASRSYSKQQSRGHSFPGSGPIHTVLLVEAHTGRLLGAQMVGREGVTGRIDVFATTLHAGMTVERIEELDLGYAPPLAPVYDPVLIAASVARKALGGHHKPLEGKDG